MLLTRHLNIFGDETINMKCECLFERQSCQIRIISNVPISIYRPVHQFENNN